MNRLLPAVTADDDEEATMTMTRLAPRRRALRNAFTAIAALAAMTFAAGTAHAWSFQLGSPQPITFSPSGSGLRGFVARDGHFSVMPSQEADYAYLTMYPGFQSYRLLGTSRFLEDMKVVSPPNPIIGGKVKDQRTWYNGGLWMTSASRLGGSRLIGFVHAEHHWTFDDEEGRGIGWFSGGVTYSDDNGRTWAPPQQIISIVEPVPDKPRWGGEGNPNAVWDAKNNRWLLYFGRHTIRVAQSTDREGRPGTWFKYYNGSFSEPGLGDRSSPLSCLDRVPGSAPGVSWNSYLNKYVMTFQAYADKASYITASDDGLTWDCPKLLVSPSAPGRRAWYPTLVGDQTDQETGQTATLYYIDMGAGHEAGAFSRAYVKVPVSFSR
jgi:hypothetical protein